MAEHPDLSILSQLLMLLASSVLVVLLFARLRLPPILGYLAVGMLLGPYALNFTAGAVAPILADLGVVFLVFTLGLEFSLPRLIAMRREAFLSGGRQVMLTTAASAVVLWGLEVPPLTAVMIGGALAMSSTAIVIRQLGGQAELKRTHRRLAIGL